MNADQWQGVLTLLNEWLEDNHADPAISFVDLSFYRDNVDDLADQGNFQLAVDAMQAHANQKGYAVPAGLPGSLAGVMDGQTFATLLHYSALQGHPIPPALLPTASAIQSALGGLGLSQLAAVPVAAAIQAMHPWVPQALGQPPTVAPAPMAPIVSLRDVQHALNLVGGAGTPLVEDGLNGPKTVAAVKAFQAAHGLTVDGIAGPKTKAALQQAIAAVGVASPMPGPVIPGMPAPTAMAAPALAGLPTLRDVQHALNLVGGVGTALVEDGVNGPKTIAAVKAFQAAHGLTVDGVAGPKTKASLQQASVGVQAPQPLTAALAFPGISPPVSAVLAQAPIAVPALATPRDVQHALNVLAGPGTPLVEDGVNGPKTVAAVKAFQAAHGLNVDGVAGPQTKAAIQAAIASAAPHPATQASLGLMPIAAAKPPAPVGLVKIKAPPPARIPAALPAAPGLSAVLATAPVTTSVTGSWKLATNADVTRDEVANRFSQLLSQPVGTETAPEVHNGRTWKFRVISKQTDPALTSYAKDIKGYVLQPLAATGS